MDAWVLARHARPSISRWPAAARGSSFTSRRPDLTAKEPGGHATNGTLRTNTTQTPLGATFKALTIADQEGIWLSSRCGCVAEGLHTRHRQTVDGESRKAQGRTPVHLLTPRRIWSARFQRLQARGDDLRRQPLPQQGPNSAHSSILGICVVQRRDRSRTDGQCSQEECRALDQGPHSCRI